MYAVHVNSIEATVNDILREWRDLWPGGLGEEEYSTLNLLAHCRHGELGFNHARCQHCRHGEWYASSCGDRHCPNCLGPRQAEWSEKVCQRLPDCPHFHVVFTVPEEFHDFFEGNYRIAADELFGAAAETLKLFQKNNWRMEGGFLAVLHTWGRALNWHPHLSDCLPEPGTGTGNFPERPRLRSVRRPRNDRVRPARNAADAPGSTRDSKVARIDPLGPTPNSSYPLSP